MRVEEGNNKNEKIFYVGDQPFRVIFNKDLKEFYNLDLSNRLYYNTEVLINKSFFKLWDVILDKVANQNRFFRDINSFSEKNIQEARYINQRMQDLKENGKEAINKLNDFLKSLNLDPLNDFFDGQQISTRYMETYFKDNLWFEIFCYYFIIRYIRKKKNSLKKDKDYYIILGQDMRRKDYQYQIDVILLLPKKVVLVSAKSGNEEQNHVLSFSKQNGHLDGDLALVLFYRKYSGNRLGEKDFIKVIDNVSNLKFADIEKGLDQSLSSYL